jgi:hypothetical protein
MRYAAILAALALATVAVAPSAAIASAPADESVAQPLQDPPEQTEALAKVIILYANNSGKGIDPSIGDMPQLKQPPFSAYDTYELLERAKVPFSNADWGGHGLPNGGKLAFKLNAVKNKKYDVAAKIDRPGGKTLLNANVKAKEGEIFFLAGPKYKEGILVLGIRFSAK